MNFAFKLPNRSAEFRYSTHEATEECHHTQMFQEFRQPLGPDVPAGACSSDGRPLPAAGRALGAVRLLLRRVAGEEPIDHVQSRCCARATTCTRCCSGSCRS